MKEAMTIAERLIQRGRQEGIQKGLQEGIQRGRQEGMHQGEYRKACETAEKMLKDGLPTDIILKYTGLSREDLEKIIKRKC